MKNKTLLIMVLVLVLASFTVEAGFLDGASEVLRTVWDFEPIYDKNPKAWDFIFFALIFNIIAWFGLIKAFPDNKVAAYILSAVIGALLGLAAVKSGMSIEFLIPLVKNLFFLIIVSIIFYVFGYVFGMNKFWAFIIAIVVTFFAFNLVGIFSAIDISDSGDRFKTDPNIREIEEELYNLASDYSVDLRDTQSTLERVQRLKSIVDDKINEKIAQGDSSSPEYKKLIKDRNRLTFLEVELQEILDLAEITKKEEFAASLEPYVKALSAIDKETKPEERFPLINDLLQKIERGLTGSGNEASSTVSSQTSISRRAELSRLLEASGQTLSAEERNQLDFAHNFMIEFEKNPSSTTIRRLAQDANDEQTKLGLEKFAKILEVLEKPGVKAEFERDPSPRTIRKIAAEIEDEEIQIIFEEFANILESTQRIEGQFTH